MMNNTTRPHIAQIETTTKCVGLCGFCPHACVIQNRPEFMSIETFSLVLERMEAAGGFNAVYLFGNGDPFCDPRLVELAAMVPYKYHVMLYTTLGMKLTKEMVKMSRRCDIVLSAAPLSKAGQALRNENLKAISVTEVHAVADERCILRGMGLAAATGTGIKVFPLHNWLGQVKTLMPVNAGTCDRVGNEMYVLTDGTVTLCCMDGTGEYRLGSLITDSVEDVYSRVSTQRYLNKEHGLPGCDRCTIGGDLKELINED